MLTTAEEIREGLNLLRNDEKYIEHYLDDDRKIFVLRKDCEYEDLPEEIQNYLKRKQFNKLKKRGNELRKKNIECYKNYTSFLNSYNSSKNDEEEKEEDDKFDAYPKTEDYLDKDTKKFENENPFLNKKDEIIGMYVNQTAGLRNINENCFMNAGLQILAYTFELNTIIFNNKLSSEQSSDNMNFNELYNEKQNVSANNPIFENKIEISHEISQKIITYWKIILSNMWDRRLTDTDYKNLVTIRNDLFPKNKIQQQDVSEFLEKFISHLNSAISVENTIEKDANSTDCAKFLENSNEYSEIKKIFYSVCIDNNNKQEYFFNYIPFKTEFSDSLNEYMANKKICFLPSIFIFVIHRNNDNKKITELMKYPTYLNMQEYCVKEIKITDYNYKLYGVACHTNQPDTGGVNTTTHGHYYAYVYNDNTLKWYKYNDEIVETLTDEDIKNTKFVTPDAYMLFYRRINN